MCIFRPESLEIKAANDAATALYGYCRKDMLSLTIWDLRPESEIPKLKDELNKQKQGYNDSGIFLHKKKNAEHVYVRIMSYPIKWEGVNCKLVVAQDVTDLKSAEKKLQELYRKEKSERLRIERINSHLTLLEKIGDTFAEKQSDHTSALQKVAKLLVEEVADVCSFDIFEDGSLKRIAQEVILPEKKKLIQRIRKKYPDFFHNLDLLKRII
jgi:PAS domain S-box-containing protein